MCRNLEGSRYQSMVESANEWARKADPIEAIAIRALANAVIELQREVDRLTADQMTRMFDPKHNL
jgi:hypothetical protein